VQFVAESQHGVQSQREERAFESYQLTLRRVAAGSTGAATFAYGERGVLSGVTVPSDY
jgi:hypothetical protein